MNATTSATVIGDLKSVVDIFSSLGLSALLGVFIGFKLTKKEDYKTKREKLAEKVICMVTNGYCIINMQSVLFNLEFNKEYGERFFKVYNSMSEGLNEILHARSLAKLYINTEVVFTINKIHDLTLILVKKTDNPSKLNETRNKIIDKIDTLSKDLAKWIDKPDYFKQDMKELNKNIKNLNKKFKQRHTEEKPPSKRKNQI